MATKLQLHQGSEAGPGRPLPPGSRHEHRSCRPLLGHTHVLLPSFLSRRRLSPLCKHKESSVLVGSPFICLPDMFLPVVNSEWCLVDSSSSPGHHRPGFRLVHLFIARCKNVAISVKRYEVARETKEKPQCLS